jgi:hypothetical protein
MWEPRRLTTLWASTACYRDSFTFLLLQVILNRPSVQINYFIGICVIFLKSQRYMREDLRFSQQWLWRVQSSACNALLSGKPMSFRRIISRTSSGSKNKLNVGLSLDYMALTQKIILFRYWKVRVMYFIPFNLRNNAVKMLGNFAWAYLKINCANNNYVWHIKVQAKGDKEITKWGQAELHIKPEELPRLTLKYWAAAS